MKRFCTIIIALGLACTLMNAQGNRITLVGEYHCFLRNYLPQNEVIRLVEGPKIILFENHLSYNALLHDPLLYRDSARFLEGTGNNRQKGRMGRLWALACNNYYQVIRANPDALSAFIDTRYTCSPASGPFRPTNLDSARAGIRKRYQKIFRTEKVDFGDWSYLSEATCLRSWESYAADLEARLLAGRLSDRQKMLVFHFFQENLVLCHEGMSVCDPARDSLFFKQIAMLTRVFPKHAIVALHGARHTRKTGGELYRFLTEAGMQPKVYSILYEHFEEPSVNNEEMVTSPELKFTEARDRAQLEILDVRSCMDCSGDYTIYFGHPETILGFMHFFETD